MPDLTDTEIQRRKTSWKTTTAGLVTAIAAVANAISLLLDNNSATNPDWTATIAAVSAGLGLLFARDNKVRSEDVGA
jgi:anti-sigma-K factor RskA